eukprot:jgi/Chlat1/1202/Chrsp115S01667
MWRGGGIGGGGRGRGVAGPLGQLTPVRIDLELEGRRLKDSFLWNTDEPETSYVPFARQLCAEKDLPKPFVHAVAAAIQAQVGEYQAVQAAGSSGANLHYDTNLHVIKLDVRVGNLHLTDQFVWDISNRELSPEAFAEQLCRDVHVDHNREMPIAVATAIREEVFQIMKKHQRDRAAKRSGSRRDPAIAATNTGSVPISQRELRKQIQKNGPIRRRADIETWEPVLQMLTDKEVEALDAKEEREARYKRRQEERENEQQLGSGRRAKRGAAAVDLMGQPI